MPYINIKTNTKISSEKEIILKNKLGKAIEIIPGKSENWLMICFEDNCNLFFKGNNSEKIAFAEIKLFGSPNGEAFANFTKEVTSIISNELSVSPAQIYIKYETTNYWGFNGKNF